MGALSKAFSAAVGGRIVEDADGTTAVCGVKLVTAMGSWTSEILGEAVADLRFGIVTAGGSVLVSFATSSATA